MPQRPGVQGGFPKVIPKHRAASVPVKESSVLAACHGHVEVSHEMDRDEAERQEMRRKNICFWYNAGEKSRFGDDDAEKFLVQVLC